MNSDLSKRSLQILSGQPLQLEAVVDTLDQSTGEDIGIGSLSTHTISLTMIVLRLS